MKPQFRVLGMDDGPFKFSEQRAVVVGVVARKGYVDAVLKTRVAVDGDDSTAALAELVLSSGYADQLEAVMLDGACVAGFNVVDINELHRRTSLPVVTVTRDRPDMPKIRDALRRLGTSPGPGRRMAENWRERLARLERTRLIEVDTGHKPVYVGFVGIEAAEAKGIVRASTVRGAIPEPLRLAHMIARAFATGTSGSRRAEGNGRRRARRGSESDGQVNAGVSESDGRGVR